MKKLFLFFSIICFISQPAFSEVNYNLNNLTLQGEYLKEKYDAYTIKFINNGKNPVRVTNIEVSNAVTNAESLLTSYNMSISKKDKKLLYLSPLTLGITGLVYTVNFPAKMEKSKIEIAEASKFNQISSFVSIGTVLVPEMTKTINVLVPKGETPEISAAFQDIKTNEYLMAKQENKL